MTGDRHPLDDEIRSFLADRGALEPPPTLTDAIAASVRRTRQARRGWWPRPIAVRGAVLAFAAAVAVSVVIAAIGVRLLGGGRPPPASSGGPGVVATTRRATPAPTDRTSTQVPSPARSAAESDSPTTIPSPSASENAATAAPLPGTSWTLVADEPGGGDPATIETATTRTDFQRAWRRIIGTKPPPSFGVDEFAVFFHKGMPWSCTTIRLSALEFEPAEHVLYGVWTRPRDCSSEIGSVRTVVVTVKRSAVPSGELRIRISRELDYPCGAACGFDEETSITLPATLSLIPIQKVPGSARTVIERRLQAAAGTTCRSAWSGTVALPSDAELKDVDRRVAADGSPFWYSDTFWVGERGPAPGAFGASAAVEDVQSDLWIEVGTGASSEGIRLGRVDTPAGNAMWFRQEGVKAIPCGGATDPPPTPSAPNWGIGGIDRDRAIAIATPLVRASARLVSAESGPFVVVTLDHDRLGPGYPVSPDQLVWAVTFDDIFVICRPDGSGCFSPRPGRTTIILDYRTGEFLVGQGLSEP